jgi:hypothetical protein
MLANVARRLAAAARIARSLVTRRLALAGVWLPEQGVEPEPFFDALA